MGTPPRDREPRFPWRRLAMLGLGALACFAVALFPARLAWEWFGRGTAPLGVLGVDGSVWDGSATGVYYRQLPLGRAEWQWQPLALLLGQWRYHLVVEGTTVTIEGGMGRSLGGALVGSDVRVRGAVADVLRLLTDGARLPLAADGALDLEIGDLVIRDDQVDELEGVLAIDDLGVAGSRLGTYAADLAARDGGVAAEFHGQDDASRGIEGVVLLLPGGEYRFTASIPDPDRLGEQIAAVIRALGKQAADGAWRLEQGGKL